MKFKLRQLAVVFALAALYQQPIWAAEFGKWSPGRYALRLGGERVSFDALQGYEDLYGTPSVGMQFGVDWLPLNLGADLGLGFRTLYWSKEGEACDKQACMPETGHYPTKTGSKTRLTYTPLQFLGVASLQLFREILELQAWGGIEYGYFQEVRVDTKFAIKGWHPAMVGGFAVNLLMNPLDESSAQRLENSLGFGFVYFSLFGQATRRIQKDEGADFSRMGYGLGFTFESSR